jgi:hypothetical protein
MVDEELDTSSCPAALKQAVKGAVMTGILTVKVVEASRNRLFGMIPCLSSALMLHTGRRFLLVDADTLTVEDIAAKSVKEADRQMDELEASWGRTTAHWSVRGQEVVVAIPNADPMKPELPVGTFPAGMAGAEEELRKLLTTPDVMDRIRSHVDETRRDRAHSASQAR